MEPILIFHKSCRVESWRIPKTFLKGQVCPNQECITERINNTCLQKYGSKRPAGNKEINAKIIATK